MGRVRAAVVRALIWLIPILLEIQYLCSSARMLDWLNGRDPRRW